MTAKSATRILRNNRYVLVPTLATILSCVATRAFAAGAGMPWEGPLMSLVSSLTGPVAKAIGMIAIAACGAGLAFGEGGHGAKKIIGVLLGISVIFTAGSFWVSFLGFSGGLGL